jgi:hypothetical protein
VGCEWCRTAQQGIAQQGVAQQGIAKQGTAQQRGQHQKQSSAGNSSDDGRLGVHALDPEGWGQHGIARHGMAWQQQGLGCLCACVRWGPRVCGCWGVSAQREYMQFHRRGQQSLFDCDTVPHLYLLLAASCTHTGPVSCSVPTVLQAAGSSSTGPSRPGATAAGGTAAASAGQGSSSRAGGGSSSCCSCRRGWSGSNGCRRARHG